MSLTKVQHEMISRRDLYLYVCIWKVAVARRVILYCTASCRVVPCCVASCRLMFSYVILKKELS